MKFHLRHFQHSEIYKKYLVSMVQNNKKKFYKLVILYSIGYTRHFNKNISSILDRYLQILMLTNTYVTL